MKFKIALACFAIFFALLTSQSMAGGALPQGGDKGGKVASFSLSNVSYFHRFTQNDQHEYTPAGQENLDKWTDMVTLLFYRKVTDGEALAATANNVLEAYKADKGVVLKTDSVPRTRDKPAEHLIVVVLGRPGFLEAVFTRLRMHGGVGSAVVYSHRIYGKAVGDAMSAWVKANGPATEAALMKWDSVPKTLSPR